MTQSDRFLEAVLRQVPFEGFSQPALDAARVELGLSRDEARALAPRGPVGMAAAYHRQGDAKMLQDLAATDQTGLKFREKIALAVRLRLQDADRELVRRGTALFALPQHAAEGARLIWGTADAIWTALGDTSEDFNWYSKRLTLSGVISSTVLYWLGDTSDEATETWAFLDRRIEDVMRIETAKARLREVPALARLFDSPLNPLNKLRKPAGTPEGYPGKWQA